MLGSKGRSGDQWDIWQAVYSPVGPMGTPNRYGISKPGVIDAFRGGVLERKIRSDAHPEARLENLGPKLTGKIHIYCGDMDNYYLNNAVYRMEDFLKSTRTPHYYGEVDYGDRAEHCWNGDHTVAQLYFATTLQHDVPAQNLETNRNLRTRGRGFDQLAVLNNP